MTSLETPTVIEKAQTRVSGNDEKGLRRWRLTLFASMSAGVVFVLSGLILGAFSYLGFVGNAETINQTGNFLIIAAFALMMLGAHALDKINEIKINQKQR